MLMLLIAALAVLQMKLTRNPPTLRGFWMTLDRRCVRHGPRYLTSSKHLFPSYKQLAHELKLQEVGDSLTDVDARVVALESLCSDLTQDNAKIKMKLNDLENRSRWNNIRVIGIPERSEGPRPTAYMESFLLEVFGKDSFTKPPVIDRAHRSLAPPPKQNQPPPPMIVRIHHFQTKEHILRLSRERGRLFFREARVHFYPDLSAELAKKRAAFVPVKGKLREAGIEFALLHPSHLRIVHGGTKHFFDPPQDATAFLQEIAPAPAGE